MRGCLEGALQIVGMPADLEVGGFLWQNGVITGLPLVRPAAINDLGHVVGFWNDHVGIWDGTAFRPHDSDTNLAPNSKFAINNHDEFVGARNESSGDLPAYPFVAKGNRFKQLSDFGMAVDINDRGDVIGERWQVSWVGWPLWFQVVTLDYGAIWSRGCALTCCPDPPNE